MAQQVDTDFSEIIYALVSNLLSKCVSLSVNGETLWDNQKLDQSFSQKIVKQHILSNPKNLQNSDVVLINTDSCSFKLSWNENNFSISKVAAPAAAASQEVVAAPAAVEVVAAPAAVQEVVAAPAAAQEVVAVPAAVQEVVAAPAAVQEVVAAPAVVQVVAAPQFNSNAQLVNNQQTLNYRFQ